MYSSAGTNQAPSGAVSQIDTDHSSLPPLEECGEEDDDEDGHEDTDHQGNNGDNDDPPVEMPEVMEEAQLGNILAIVSVIAC